MGCFLDLEAGGSTKTVAAAGIGGSTKQERGEEAAARHSSKTKLIAVFFLVFVMVLMGCICLLCDEEVEHGVKSAEPNGWYWLFHVAKEGLDGAHAQRIKNATAGKEEKIGRLQAEEKALQEEIGAFEAIISELHERACAAGNLMRHERYPGSGINQAQASGLQDTSQKCAEKLQRVGMEMSPLVIEQRRNRGEQAILHRQIKRKQEEAYSLKDLLGCICCSR